jgi:hypothetical protein
LWELSEEGSRKKKLELEEETMIEGSGKRFLDLGGRRGVLLKEAADAQDKLETTDEICPQEKSSFCGIDRSCAAT